MAVLINGLLFLALPLDQNDLPLDDNNYLVQVTKLFDQSKNLLLANVSAIGTGTVCKPCCLFLKHTHVPGYLFLNYSIFTIFSQFNWASFVEMTHFINFYYAVDLLCSQLDEAERYWFAFVLYSVRRLSDNVGSADKPLNLCQILRAARLKYFLLSKTPCHFEWLMGNFYLLVIRQLCHFVLQHC